MICSRSSKSDNNKISTFLELECLIKLLYPDRSNINNTKFAVVGTLVDEKIKNFKTNKPSQKRRQRHREVVGC